MVGSPCCPRDSQESSPAHFESINSLTLSVLYGPTLTSVHVKVVKKFRICTGRTIALTRQTFVGQVMSMIFNTLSKFVIAFLSRSKHLLILWLQSLSTVILDPKKIKSATVFIFPHLFAMK